MYKDDDTMTPRDRISDDMLRRLLGDSLLTPPAWEAPSPDHDHGCGDYGHDHGCSDHSGRHTWGLENYPLASVYAPLQTFHALYDKDTALKAGTIFSELDLPFMGKSVKKGGMCRD